MNQPFGPSALRPISYRNGQMWLTTHASAIAFSRRTTFLLFTFRLQLLLIGFRSVRAPSKRSCACSALDLDYDSKSCDELQLHLYFTVLLPQLLRRIPFLANAILTDAAATMVCDRSDCHHALEFFFLLRFHYLSPYLLLVSFFVGEVLPQTAPLLSL